MENLRNVDVGQLEVEEVRPQVQDTIDSSPEETNSDVESVYDSEGGEDCGDSDTNDDADTEEDVGEESIGPQGMSCPQLCGQILRVIGDAEMCKACGRHLRDMGDQLYIDQFLNNVGVFLQDMAEDENMNMGD